MQNKMNAYQIDSYGQEKLNKRMINVPGFGDDELLIEIHAAGVNPVDYKIRDGKMKFLVKHKMPLTLGQEFSGVVVNKGKNVTRFSTGDKVYGRIPNESDGTFAEFVSVTEDTISKMPENLSFEESASIPLVGLTSYQVIKQIMNAQPGENILITAGSGGVGTFAIQLAKSMGLHVATTVSNGGVELVKSLGADEIINYHTESIIDKLSDYDYAFDNQGGSTLTDEFRILKNGGHIVSINGMPNARFAKYKKMNGWKSLILRAGSHDLTKLEKKYNVTYDFWLMEPNGSQLSKIAGLIEKGKIKPVIDKVFDFAHTQDAIDYQEVGHAKGKIIITVK